MRPETLLHPGPTLAMNTEFHRAPRDAIAHAAGPRNLSRLD
jgi:hypothetical protein